MSLEAAAGSRSGKGKASCILTTRYRSKIKPTPTLLSNIDYPNYGHHGLFPVINSTLAQHFIIIGSFFVFTTLQPIGEELQTEGSHLES